MLRGCLYCVALVMLKEMVSYTRTCGSLLVRLLIIDCAYCTIKFVATPLASRTLQRQSCERALNVTCADERRSHGEYNYREDTRIMSSRIIITSRKVHACMCQRVRSAFEGVSQTTTSRFQFYPPDIFSGCDKDHRARAPSFSCTFLSSDGELSFSLGAAAYRRRAGNLFIIIVSSWQRRLLAAETG